MAISLEQLSKFCAPKGFHPTASWQEGPFRISKWQIATDGYILIAANGSFKNPPLPEIDSKDIRENILQWINFPIPQQKYSLDHLQGFLGAKEIHGSSVPIMFGGQRIDRQKLRKVIELADSPYSFGMREHCFHFQFGNITALVMGMMELSAFDPRYEPKAIAEIVLR